MTAFSAEELGKHANSLRALARDLLADEALAEDAVQDAWVTALTRPPRGALAGWLRTVVGNRAVDLRRSEQRRRRHEQMVTRDAASEDVDAAGQLELQQDILTAVRSLEPAYRTAIWMRYYEHRTPSQIARALGEPVKTVKTRLWRALQMLRQKLDSRYGARRAWLPALLPLVGIENQVVGLGAASAAGALLMQTKYLVAAAVLTLALVGGAAFFWWDTAPPALPLPAAASVKGSAEQATAEQVPHRTEEVTGQQAPGEQVSPYGSLLVRVHWHDGEPAAQIAVYCDVDGEPQLDRNELRLVSDSKGMARAASVHAGAVRLSSERGGRVTAKVVPGAACELDFVLPRSLDVTGTVVDERQLPVASAQVVLVSPRGGWLGGRDVAVTDEVGAFSVRSVDPTWSFGARKSGYAPSALVDLDDVAHSADATTVQVQLRLGAQGSAVTGKVVDQDGAGIAEATVALGYSMGAHFEAGRFREEWSPLVVTTGSEGIFTCEGVAPGLQEIVAWADGCTRAQDTVQCVAGQTARITLALVRGVTVKGTVRNQTGEVMAHVVVRSPAPADFEYEAIGYAMHESSREKRPHTRSDANGRYVLRGIPPGQLRLVAAKPAPSSWSYEGFCQVALIGRVGEELTWDPVLVTSKQIRVRVLDALGATTYLSLTARAEEPAGLATLLQAPMPERKAPGTYVISGCADVPYTIGGRLDRQGAQTQWVYRTGVIPGGPDVELRLPPEPPTGAPGQIAGRIADPWQRLTGRPISVMLSTSGSGQHLTVDGDRFSAKDVQPGRYFIFAKAGQDPVLVSPWFELQPGQRLDLGDLSLDPGARIRVVLRAPEGAELIKPAVSLRRWFQWWPLRWDGSQLAADNVTVGRYQLTVSIAGWYAAEREVELRAGQDHVFELDLVPAARRRFDLVLPLPDQWQRCDFTLRDGAGNVVSQLSDVTPAGVGLDPWRWTAQQPFGLFTLEAVLDGQKRTWPVDLRDPATGDRPLRFSLR